MPDIIIRSPYYPGESRIAIDDLRGDALMQRITDLVEDGTITYTICRTINNTENVGILVNYDTFKSYNTLATGDKPPSYEYGDVTDDWLLTNLDVAFDIIRGNEQQSLASKNRYLFQGSKAEFDEATATGGAVDVEAPILEPDRVSVTLVTGGAELTGGAFTVSGPGGTVTVAENTGEAMTVRYNKMHYATLAIRRSATPFPTGGFGPIGVTGPEQNRLAVLMNIDHFDSLTGVQP